LSLKDNLNKVLQEISAAAKNAGRNAEQVKLIAVSKTVDVEAIKEMHAAGQKVFAENRAQTLRDKHRILADLPVEWHFIGPLQSNKIKYVYPVAALVHSIDREDILEQFIAWSKKTGRQCPCLLEVHISAEETKHGFAPEEVLDVIKKYNNNEHLNIVGIMGMAPFADDQQLIRKSFRKLAELFAKSKELEGKSYQAQELSMGMSGDFKIAIEEGATLVRIGTALFAGDNR
jgi:pyridoxal phosphate enzyme (YggS family)